MLGSGFTHPKTVTAHSAGLVDYSELRSVAHEVLEAVKGSGWGPKFGWLGKKFFGKKKHKTHFIS